jgi:hypothetical protein
MTLLTKFRTALVYAEGCGGTVGARGGAVG